jgi:uncharacterized protein
MKTEVAFWDSSALLMLCLQQSGTSAGRRYARQFPHRVIWWGTPVEMESAISRLRGNQKIDDDGFRHARRTWQTLQQSMLEIQPCQKVRELAESLPHSYGLRALDAFQLAAALEWCSDKPRRRAFVTFDVKLGDAARKAGFSVYS